MVRVPQQIIPLALFFLLGLASLILARQFLVPDTFGEYGHYRADSEDDNRDKPLVYAGFAVCGDCHDDIVAERQGFGHEGVSCEVCHGPLQQHVEDMGETTPRIPRGREFCELCHGYNPSRPSGFPQILVNSHYPAEACTKCHDAHSPQAELIGICAGCHREIANQKSLSHHASLECTRCHGVPAGHSAQPRLVRASKPSHNSLCGGCHDNDEGVALGAPQIDVVEHSGRYHCWDCHYPHFPEANR
jgi:hypothetical protein